MKTNNFKEKVKSPQFWIAIVITFFSNLFIMSGVEFAALTTWSAFGSVILAGLANPFIIISVITLVYLAGADFSAGGDNGTNLLKSIVTKKPNKK